MEKLQKGTMVEHKGFGFKGVIIGEYIVPDSYMIEITEGTNPFKPEENTYFGFAENLIVLEEEPQVDETADVEEEPDAGTYDVEIKLPDGTIIRFDTVIDFLMFVDHMEMKNK